jgi:branched-chain amino acid transport system permease protein
MSSVFAVSWFSSNEALIQNALIAAMLAYSVQVALRAGVFSFSGIGFYGIAAYGVGYLLGKKGWSTVPAIVVVLIGTGVLSLGLGLVLARLRALYLAMATLALVLLVRTAATVWDDVTGGSLGLFGVPPVFSTTTVALLVALTALAAALSQRGATGRRLLVLRTDESLAGASGVDVRRNHLIAVVFSSLIGALAGACHIVLLTVFTPENVGFHVLTSTLTVLVIGGTWHWAGPLIGGFIVAWLPTWLASLEEWRIVVQGAIVIAMVIYLPAGVAGLFDRLRNVLRRTPPAALQEESPESPSGAKTRLREAKVST